MPSSDYEYFKAEKVVILEGYKLSGQIELKEALVGYLAQFPASPMCKRTAKRYAKDIEGLRANLAENKTALQAMQKQREQEESAEKKEESTLPPEILKMSDDTVADIHVATKAEEDFEKLKAQIAELAKEIKKYAGKDFSDDPEFLAFVQELAKQKAEMEQRVAGLEKEFDELNLKALREIYELIDTIDMFQKGRFKPGSGGSTPPQKE